MMGSVCGGLDDDDDDDGTLHFRSDAITIYNI